ncbi:MAG TPA: peroxide stress protein YaaA, partial [Pseudonocardia sp.]|nr:peroxide stress protein YaaA [Pseudonocardia sp.]
SLRGASAARAAERLAVGSALFGLLRADDPVPAYRLSAGSALPGRGTLTAFWRPALDPVLAGLDGLVVDLRSGSYAALGRIPGAVTVRVLTERADGTRSVVSHHNKASKGRVARLLASSRAEPTDVAGVVRLLHRAGLAIERGETADELDLVLPEGGQH